jgi:hypothetical protein
LLGLTGCGSDDTRWTSPDAPPSCAPVSGPS